MASDKEYLHQIRRLLSEITLPPWETGAEKTGGYMQMPIVSPSDPKQISAIGYMVFPSRGGPVALSLFASPELVGDRPLESTPEQAKRNADFIAQAPSIISFLLRYIDDNIRTEK